MGIIQLYKKDIAKYDPNENLNEHFKFSIYEHSFIWLKEAGVALPVFCAQEPRIPLLLSKATNMFKLFLSDVGCWKSRDYRKIIFTRWIWASCRMTDVFTPSFHVTPRSGKGGFWLLYSSTAADERSSRTLHASAGNGIFRQPLHPTKVLFFCLGLRQLRGFL